MDKLKLLEAMNLIDDDLLKGTEKLEGTVTEAEKPDNTEHEITVSGVEIYRRRGWQRFAAIASALVLTVGVTFAGGYFLKHRKPITSDKDTLESEAVAPTTENDSAYVSTVTESEGTETTVTTTYSPLIGEDEVTETLAATTVTDNEPDTDTSAASGKKTTTYSKFTETDAVTTVTTTYINNKQEAATSANTDKKATTTTTAGTTTAVTSQSYNISFSDTLELHGNDTQTFRYYYVDFDSISFAVKNDKITLKNEYKDGVGTLTVTTRYCPSGMNTLVCITRKGLGTMTKTEIPLEILFKCPNCGKLVHDEEVAKSAYGHDVCMDCYYSGVYVGTTTSTTTTQVTTTTTYPPTTSSTATAKAVVDSNGSITVHIDKGAVFGWYTNPTLLGSVTLADFPEYMILTNPGTGTICYYYNDERKDIINGFAEMPFNAYFTDLNGDGYPELCASVEGGSGIGFEFIVVYDFKAEKKYTLSDPVQYNYKFITENQKLCVLKCSYGASWSDAKMYEPSISGNEISLQALNGKS